MHNRCSGVKGSLKENSSYQCSKCKVNGTSNKEVEVVKAERLLLENGTSVECVDEFCYLEDMLSSDGGAGEASRVRVKCAWKKFRELSPILVAKGASLTLKGKIYSACIRSSMTYGSETWPMKVEDMHRLKDRKSSEESRQRLEIGNVADVIRRNRLRWFGHVERKDDVDCVKACQRLEVSGRRDRGRVKKTWRACVAEDMRVIGLKECDVHDR